MTDLKELIEQELDQYLEWPTADKGHVTTVSAKLFAEHVATLYADHIRDAGEMVAPAMQGEPVGWQFYQHGEWCDGDDTVKGHRKNTEEAGFRVRDVYAAPQPALTKYQPCGCVICTCEHETQCQGCGAKHCGTHLVGQIPGPAYQQPVPDVAALVEALVEALRGVISTEHLEHAQAIANGALGRYWAAHRKGGES